MLSDPIRIYFFSPHPDDVALSCGGMIAKFISEGKDVRVVNIFSSASSDLSFPNPLAEQYLKEDLNKTSLSADDYRIWKTLRQEEDKKGLFLLGISDSKIYNLNMKDAIFRSDLNSYFYQTEPSLFQTIMKQDKPLLLDILKSIQQLDIRIGDLLFFPVGIGSHVDHQFAFLCGMNFFKRGFNIIFYEEFPYNINESKIRSRLDNIDFSLRNMDIGITQFREIKQSSILQYQSQIKGLFQSKENLLNILNFIYRKRSYSERCWIIGEEALSKYIQRNLLSR